MSNGIEPLEATGFREACIELLEQWEELDEDGDPVDDQYAFEFFLDHYGNLPVDSATATLRFLNVMDALEEPPLCEFMADTDDGKVALHTAIFESAALAPISEDGELDIAWITRDLGQRLLQIATLENLLGELED